MKNKRKTKSTKAINNNKESSIQKETLLQMDKSMKNINKGEVYGPIDLKQ